MAAAQSPQSEAQVRARKIYTLILCFGSVLPGLLGAVVGVLTHIHQFFNAFVPVFFGGLCVAAGAIPFVILARMARRSLETQQSSQAVWIGALAGGSAASAWTASRICVDTEGLVLLMLTGIGEVMMVLAVTAAMLLGYCGGFVVHRIASRKRLDVHSRV